MGKPSIKKPQQRSSRLGLRATREQERMLRVAAAAASKSLTDFVLDAACDAAMNTLLDQRLLWVSKAQGRALAALLDRPPRENPGIRKLFSAPAPWKK